MVDGIYKLMQSGVEGPTNIGSPEYVTVRELVETVAEVAGKHVQIEWVHGPVGVQSRNFSNAKIYSSGWQPQFTLAEGLRKTYPWIEQQVTKAARSNTSVTAS